MRSGRSVLWRRAFLLGAVLAVTGGAILLWRSATAPRSTGEPIRTASLPWQRPNIVLITIDTLRADRLSCYGSTAVATPALDRLAGDGVRFTNAATTVPFTLPAHSSIMTGVYPPTHGVRENVGFVLDERLATLAGSLADAGYSTAGFVSAFVLDSRWGIGRGFATYYDDFSAEQKGAINLGAVQRDGRETLKHAVGWLEERPPGPFFLWLHLFEPHDPYAPPEPFLSRYPGRPYDGEVAYADSLVGDLTAALEQQNLLDSTLLVATGDHGEGLGQHGEGFHGFFVYDSTVHVPLIVRLPGRRSAGRTVSDAVSHVDLLPTLLEAAGKDVPAQAQGHSLLPLLLGSPEPAAGDGRAVYTESLYPLLHYGWAPLRVLRSGSYKLIDAPEPELYDLASDPGERRNLLAEERLVYRQLHDRLAQLRREVENAGAGTAAPADLDPETVEQLRALGYAAGRGGVAADEEGDGSRTDPKGRIELHQLVMAAQSDLGAGDLERCRERLERALDGDPSILDAHQMLGAVALRQARPEEAAAHFRSALSLRDDHAAARLGLADAYRQLGRSAEALVGYDLVLAPDPGNTHALLASSDLLEELGRSSDAIERLETAAASADLGAGALNRLGELLVLDGRSTEAAARFESAIQRGEAAPQPRFNLAVLEEAAGNLDRAVELYEEVLGRAPRHYQAQFNLGRLHGRRGDVERQQALWEEAIASEPSFSRGYFFLGKLLMDQGGDLGRAELLIREGLLRDPEHRAGPLGHYVLADVLSRTGRRQEALRQAAEGRQIEQQAATGTTTAAAPPSVD